MNANKLLTQSINKRIAHYNDGSFTSVPLTDSLKQIHNPKKLVRTSYNTISHSKMYKRALKTLSSGIKRHKPMVDFSNQNSEQALVLGDSYKLVPYLPTGKFTLVATDPIYFMNHYYKQHKDKIARDEKRYGKANVENMHKGFNLNILDEFVRLCRGDTINILLCGSKEMVEIITDYFAKHYGCSMKNGHIDELAFIKNNTCRNKRGFRLNTEYCLYIHKNVKLRLNTNKYHMATSGYKVNTNQSEDHLYLHGTIKPLFIIKNWIQMALDIDRPNNVTPTVLDPFCGSGTTAVACKMLGVSGIFIDKDEKNAIKPSIKRLLTPEYVDWKLIEVEANHLKVMQTEFTKLMKCDYESTMTSLRDYKIRIKKDKDAIHNNNKSLIDHLNGAMRNLDDDDRCLHYIQSNPNCVGDNALHIRSTHCKKRTRTNSRIAK